MIDYIEIEKDNIFIVFQNIIKNLSNELPIIISIDEEVKNELISSLEIYNWSYEATDNFYLTNNNHLNNLIRKSAFFYQSNFNIANLVDLIKSSNLIINPIFQELIDHKLPKLKIDSQKNFADLLKIGINNPSITKALMSLNIICSHLKNFFNSPLKNNFKNFLTIHIAILRQLLKVIAINSESIKFNLEICSISSNYKISAKNYLKMVNNQINYIANISDTQNQHKLLIVTSLDPEFILNYNLQQVNIIYITKNINILNNPKLLLYKQKIFLLLYYYNHSNNSLLQNLNHNYSAHLQNENRYNLKSLSYPLIENILFSNDILNRKNDIPKHTNKENFSKLLLKSIIREKNIISITNFSLYRLINNLDDFLIIDLLNIKKYRSTINNKFSDREIGYLAGKIIRSYFIDSEDIFLIADKLVKKIAAEELFIFIKNKLEIILSNFLRWLKNFRDQYENKTNIKYIQEIIYEIRASEKIIEVKNSIPIIIETQNAIILYDFIFNNYTKSILENFKQPAIISAALYFLELHPDKEVIIKYVNLKDSDLKEIEIKKIYELSIKLKITIKEKLELILVRIRD